MLRRTLRTQLTLLYAGPFFVSGVLLLSVPILQSRGLFRRDYEGTTLRHHLGLPIPCGSGR